MASPVKVLVMGHHVVSRLYEQLKGTNGVLFLGLGPEDFSIFWTGHPELTADGLFQFLGLICDIQPAILYLEIGSNDLCHPGVEPKEVALTVFNFITACFDNCPLLGRVILGQAVLRDLTAPAQRSTRPDFGDCVKEYNNFLLRVCQKTTSVKLWKHKGLSENVTTSLLSDGVSLNEQGIKKVFHSIKRAIVTFAKVAKKDDDDGMIGVPHQ